MKRICGSGASEEIKEWKADCQRLYIHNVELQKQVTALRELWGVSIKNSKRLRAENEGLLKHFRLIGGEVVCHNLKKIKELEAQIAYVVSTSVFPGECFTLPNGECIAPPGCFHDPNFSSRPSQATKSREDPE